MSGEGSNRPTVLCALAFEERTLRRAGIGELASVIRVGQGPDRVVRWAEEHGAEHTDVVLVGLAGSLRELMPPGEAFIASTVFSPQGRRHRCGLDLHAILDGSGHIRRAVVVSSDRILRTPSEKHAFGERHGADLVDLESAVFAEAASIFGWRWAVVRGVSDGPHDTLPSGIETWTAPDGSTRVFGALSGMIGNPANVPRVIRLRRHSIDAMRNAATLCAALVRGMSGVRSRTTAESMEHQSTEAAGT